MKKKKQILILVFCFIMLSLSSIFVHADILEDLKNTGEGIANITSSLFDFIMRFINWIFITALNIYFFIIFLLYFVIIFVALWIPSSLEPYFTRLQQLSQKMLKWFRGDK